MDVPDKSKLVILGLRKWGTVVSVGAEQETLVAAQTHSLGHIPSAEVIRFKATISNINHICGPNDVLSLKDAVRLETGVFTDVYEP